MHTGLIVSMDVASSPLDDDIGDPDFTVMALSWRLCVKSYLHAHVFEFLGISRACWFVDPSGGV